MQTEKPNSKSFTQLFTRDKANAGARMDLLDDNDKPTGHWLLVRGVDSDEFQKASAAFRAAGISYLEQNGQGAIGTPAYEQFKADRLRELHAAYIAGWSFEEECTPANILKLLTEAPYITKLVDVFGSKKSPFVST